MIIFFFSKINKSELVKNIINECQRYIDGIMLQAFQILAKIFPIILVLVLLLLINFKITSFSLLFVLLLYILYYLAFKYKIQNLSKNSSKYLANIHRSLNEAFNLIDIIKIDKKESFLLPD